MSKSRFLEAGTVALMIQFNDLMTLYGHMYAGRVKCFVLQPDKIIKQGVHKC